ACPARRKDRAVSRDSPRGSASRLTVTRIRHSDDVLSPSVAVTLAAKVPGRRSARLHRASAPRPSIFPAAALHVARSPPPPGDRAQAFNTTLPRRGTVGVSALHARARGSAASPAPTATPSDDTSATRTASISLGVRLIASSHLGDGGHEPLR